MTTKKLRIPILLLVLWLLAAALLPQSYAAGDTHRVTVQGGTGYTSGEVGINVWETGVAKDVSFVPLDGYRITALNASYGDASASAAIRAEQTPTQLTVSGIVLPLQYAGRTVTVTVPGNCTGDLTLSATAEAASCKVAVTADSGIDVSGGGTYGISNAGLLYWQRENCQVMQWRYRIDTNLCTIYKTGGFDVEKEFTIRPEEFHEMLHPDDQLHVISALKELQETDKKSCELTCRLKSTSELGLKGWLYLEIYKLEPKDGNEANALQGTVTSLETV